MKTKTRKCITCEVTKPLAEFLQPGATQYSKECVSCRQSGMRRCRVCGEIKPIEKFAMAKLGFRLYTCMQCSSRKWRAKIYSSPQKLAEYRERNKTIRKKWVDDNKNYIQEYYRTKARKYYWQKSGWTEEEYYQVFTEQNGRCYICGELETAKRGEQVIVLSADHIHVDPPIPRRLLCRDCNLMLGKGKDNPSLLRKAADYLDEFGWAGNLPGAAAEPPGDSQISTTLTHPLGGAQLQA